MIVKKMPDFFKKSQKILNLFCIIKKVSYLCSGLRKQPTRTKLNIKNGRHPTTTVKDYVTERFSRVHQSTGHS